MSKKKRVAWNKGIKVGKANSGSFKKGNIPWNKNGGEYSKETREKMRKAKLGKPSLKKGRKYPNVSGKNHYRWKGDESKREIKHRLRSTIEWKIWREEIFNRDNYTCQQCGKRGCYIEPHHIIPLRIDFEKKFDVNNGITLCRPCHKLIMGKEEQFIQHYNKIIKRGIILRQ